MNRNIASDDELQKAVHDEMTWDLRLKAAEIGVAVSLGVVTLAGTLDSWEARVAAQHAAHRVIGVLDVVNGIKLRAFGAHVQSDLEIARSVRLALECDVSVPSDHIASTVSAGVVTLEGSVDTWRQHDDTERVVRDLKAVREVANLVRVESCALSPSAVRATLESALERRAHQAVKEIEISVDRDRVVLSGRVASGAERDAVVLAARNTPGVGSVSDERLQVGT